VEVTLSEGIDGVQVWWRFVEIHDKISTKPLDFINLSSPFIGEHIIGLRLDPGNPTQSLHSHLPPRDHLFNHHTVEDARTLGKALHLEINVYTSVFLSVDYQSAVGTGKDLPLQSLTINPHLEKVLDVK